VRRRAVFAVGAAGGAAALRGYPSATAGASARAQPRAAAEPIGRTPPAAAGTVLLVTNSAGRHVSFVDPADGVLAEVEVGAAPWGAALAPDGRVYVATAEGVAVVDTGRRERVAIVPYRTAVGPDGAGEYRPGGMGLAVSPAGELVYVGVHVRSGPSRLEIVDAARLEVVGDVQIGVRPFDVLAAPAAAGRREAYAIDHDSFDVAVVDATDPARPRVRVLPAAPLGRGAFDKPHYGAVRPADGRLLLPVQGRVLLELDPVSGVATAHPMRADTHQHGVALSADGGTLYVVGAGPAGGAGGGPRLTAIDLATMTEADVPLARPHERLAISPDGRYAFLAGGYSFADGGWDGLSIVDLAERTVAELPVPARPLDVLVLPAPAPAPAAAAAAGGPASVPAVLSPVPDAARDRALIEAAGRGDGGAVERLLREGAGVHAADGRGVTALIAAAYGNHLEAARLLIAAGADVNRKDVTQQSAFLIPTADGGLELLRLTIAAGADVRARDSYNGTGLIRAADRGHHEIIRELLRTELREEVDHVNRLGWTALLEAIILGDGGARHAACVRLLLDAGASPNLADGQRVTPLAHARRKGYAEIAGLLEAAGAR
jgi:DNA-binding beta-propeller fold protein YncE